MDERRKRQVVTALAQDALLRRLGRLLERQGVSAVLLKGLALRRLAYADPADRSCDDLDLLVGPARFDETTRLLASEGFAPWPSKTDARVATFSEPATRLLVDVHAELFAQGQFALPAAAIVARSRPMEGFGTTLRLPDPLDLFAHLVGHYALERRYGRRHHPEDFERLAIRQQLAPPSIAAHLHATGLATAARFTFADLGTPFARTMLEALPGSLTRDVLAGVAGRAIDVLPPSTLAAIVAAPDPRALGAHAARSLRRRAARLIQRGLGR